MLQARLSLSREFESSSTVDTIQIVEEVAPDDSLHAAPAADESFSVIGQLFNQPSAQGWDPSPAARHRLADRPLQRCTIHLLAWVAAKLQTALQSRENFDLALSCCGGGIESSLRNSNENGKERRRLPVNNFLNKEVHMRRG